MSFKCIQFTMLCLLFVACKDSTTTTTNTGGVSDPLKGGSGAGVIAEKDPNHGLVARVNGEEITQEAFDQLYEERVRTYRLKNKPIPQRLKRTYESAVLQRLIDNLLMEQYLNSQNILLTPAEVNAEMTNYKARFKGEKGYQRYLDRSNKNEEDIQKKVIYEGRINKAIQEQSDAQISEADLKTYYDQNKESRYIEKAQVRASHILIPVASNASKKLIRQRKRKAKSIYKMARKKKADFVALVKEHSGDANSKLRGGDLGYFYRKGLPKISQEFEKAAAQLKEKEISPLVQTELGWHIIKLIDRQPAQIKVSHILLKTPKAQAEASKILNRALIEDFSVVAKETSEDESTRIRGGDLGYIHSKSSHRFGDEFKAKVLNRSNGEVIGPIETSHGLHIVKVMNIRPERLRTSHILIRVPKKAKKSEIKEAKNRAKAILDDLNQTPKSAARRFIRLAKKYSEDSSKDRGGDIGSFYVGGQPKLSKAFEDRAFNLNMGEVSKPVRSPFGWHIITLTDKKERRERLFNEVKTEIKESLQKKKSRRIKSDLIKKLRDKADVVRYLKIEGAKQVSPKMRKLKMKAKIKRDHLKKKLIHHKKMNRKQLNDKR